MLAQHANFHEFQHYASGLPPDALARFLRCSTTTARAWLAGKRPAPWWAVAVLRLDALEREEMARQMGYARLLPRLGIVRGNGLRRKANKLQNQPSTIRANSAPIKRTAPAAIARKEHHHQIYLAPMHIGRYSFWRSPRSAQCY